LQRGGENQWVRRMTPVEQKYFRRAAKYEFGFIS
jgi:hypothetical protein